MCVCRFALRVTLAHKYLFPQTLCLCVYRVSVVACFLGMAEAFYFVACYSLGTNQPPDFDLKVHFRKRTMRSVFRLQRKNASVL